MKRYTIVHSKQLIYLSILSETINVLFKFIVKEAKMDFNNQQPNNGQQPDYNNQQSYYSQQGYTPQQGYNPQPGYNMQVEQPMSVGDWMITILLMCIPCVNLVMLFIWAFGSSAPKTKSNYAKATLIWIAIAIVINIVLYFTGFATFYTYLNY